jgi:hypothetical protein
VNWQKLQFATCRSLWFYILFGVWQISRNSNSKIAFLSFVFHLLFNEVIEVAAYILQFLVSYFVYYLMNLGVFSFVCCLMLDESTSFVVWQINKLLQLYNKVKNS